jgi:hypothetical protein
VFGTLIALKHNNNNATHTQMIAGEVYMTGCIIFYTSIIGLDVGMGLNIHVRAA